MKKIITLMLSLVLALALFQTSGISNVAYADTKKETLRICNWDDYMAEGITDEFVEYYNAKYNVELNLIYETFESNETIYTKIEKTKDNYDLICPSEYTIEKMIKNDLYLPMDKSIVGDIYNNSVPDFIKNQFTSVSGNSDEQINAVGYMWGTMGIMYNKEHVSIEELEEKGWGILWDEKYDGKIFMKDSIRDSVVVANIYANQEQYLTLLDEFKSGALTAEEYNAKITELFNRTDDEMLEKIQHALEDQKYTVDAMYDIDHDKDEMVAGNAYLDVCWSGDATWAIIDAAEADNGVELGYYIPKEGTNVWYDGWIIPKYAQNVRAASEFAAFTLWPENAITISDYIGYSSVVVNEDVIDYWSDLVYDGATMCDLSYLVDGKSALMNASIYPDINTIYSSAVMKDFGEDTAKVSQMWTNFKSNALSPGKIIFLIIVSAITVALIIYSNINKYKKGMNKKITHKVRTYKPE